MTINLDGHGLELFSAFDHAITLPARFKEVSMSNDGDHGKVHDSVVARLFVLVDDEDRTRATMETRDKGNAVLTLLDVNERPRIELGVGNDGKGLITLWDANSRPRAFMTVDPRSDDFVFAALDGTGETRFTIQVRGDGSAAQLGLGGKELSVLLSHAEGRAGRIITCDPDGEVQFCTETLEEESETT